MDYGAKVQLFPGVETWFKRIRDYGVDKGVIVEHYIISSGLKEMIEGTKVANEFEKIYASSFYYDKDGVAQWPAQVINYTSKTQFLFRIEKGTLDVMEDMISPVLITPKFNMPADKVSELEKLLKNKPSGKTLAFVGDGINDAPVLARADLGIAMGGLGSDAAIEAAEVVLMEDTPAKKALGVKIARKTHRLAREKNCFP